MAATETPPETVWDDTSLANPHAAADKRQRVQRMFAAIAPSYDLNNRLHSLWMDQAWRRRAVRLSEIGADDVVVDVACGTGDLTLGFFGAIWRKRAQKTKHLLGEYMKPATFASPSQVIGIDFTLEMLIHAKHKRLSWGGPTEFLDEADRAVRRSLRYINGDAQSLPLPDTSADVVSIAFGIRNVADPAAAIREFYRVLRPGGRLIILEFSLPTNPLLRGLYNFYFRKILPRTATWISRDKTGAYKYLPESVNTFITRERMQEMMRTAGFSRVEQFPMTFGVCVCYRGVKS